MIRQLQDSLPRRARLLSKPQKQTRHVNGDGTGWPRECRLALAIWNGMRLCFALPDMQDGGGSRSLFCANRLDWVITALPESDLAGFAASGPGGIRMSASRVSMGSGFWMSSVIAQSSLVKLGTAGGALAGWLPAFISGTRYNGGIPVLV
uniref:Uncharacterized protein n=1 Tax=Mycena chlorophos TaxID=658473 RepID=A0ABQ0KVB1_MYCCL|nr:predicted protein [Mycena chlorophos]